MNKKTDKGFTLIELLVVIAIIGILATVSVISLNNARAKSRDAKRAGNIKQIQTALELYFNDNGHYPSANEWSSGKIFSTSSAGTSTYMEIIPSAPSPSDGTCSNTQNTISYTPTSDGSSYSISFCLGNNTGTLNAGSKCLNPSGIIDLDCSVPTFTCGTNTITYDGYNYPTILINSQCWLKENLKTTKYNDGTSIPNLPVAADWTANLTGAYSCYDNSTANCNTYGALYNFYAVSTGKLCPSGWRVPSRADWHILEFFYTSPQTIFNCPVDLGTGQCSPAGTALQIGGISGFDVRLGGFRAWTSGSFLSLLGRTILHTSDIGGGGTYPWNRVMFPSNPDILGGYGDFGNGLSVRCLKN